MSCVLSAAQCLYQKTCHIPWLTWDSRRGGGRTCSSCLNAEGGNNARQLPFHSCFTLHLFPHTESSAGVFCIADKLYPPSEPALCLQALLSVTCPAQSRFNVCWSAIKMSIHLWQVKYHRCCRHPWPLPPLSCLPFSSHPLRLGVQMRADLQTCLGQN